MLAKLLYLLLHAKSGAISGLFLLGATGALVSVSTQNGVTTVTLTEASPSPSASASASASPSASPHSASPSASASPFSSPSSSSCADQAKALAFQVQRVDTAFKGFHTDLMKLRGTRSVADIEKADVMLKVIRQAAVRAIHKTFDKSCIKKDDDEDESAETEDHDAAPATTLSLLGDRKHDEDNDNDSDHHKTKPAPLTFTGDAKSIADQAIAAMQVAFDAAKNAPASSPRPSHKPEPSHSPRPSHSPEGPGDHR
jgi:hypothetical protein